MCDACEQTGEFALIEAIATQAAASASNTGSIALGGSRYPNAFSARAASS